MNNNVLVTQSSVSDGPFPLSKTHIDSGAYRTTFIRQQGLRAENTVLVFVDYSRSNFTEYRTVTAGSGGSGITRPNEFSADALFTEDKNLTLFLQLADCVGVVLYDTEHGVLGLSHLGRHNLEQYGGQKTIEYMREQFHSDPQYIEVFLSAAAGKEHYPLYDFENRSLHEEAIRQLTSGGVKHENITKDTRDTTTDHTLFSHSEFLKGNRSVDGRFALLATMTAK